MVTETLVSTDYNEVFTRELEKLNPEQRRAVDTIEGPVLVIAGPGTGKTQIIAARIGHILSTSEAQSQPQNILCLTYTDAGTVAMRRRLLEFIGPTAYRVHIYTFHAFCNEVIQGNLDYFGKRFLEPISELENIDILEELIDGLNPTHPLKRFKGDIYSDIGRLNNLFRMMKEENWTVDHIKESCEAYLADLPNREKFVYKKTNPAKGILAGDLKKELLAREEEKISKLVAAAELLPLYQEKMLSLNRYDFSDMILWVINAFREDENLLRGYQERYQYFLVDEFQDTNGAQNEILKLLTGFWDQPNVFCVGDDDQSIYEFQGARIKNIREFMSRYDDALQTIVLTSNYRSSQNILDAARHVIENNADRLIHSDPTLTKNLEATGENAQTLATDPVVIQYPNVAQEEAGVISKIMELQANDVPLNEIAVIYFRHAQAENIIHLLEKKGISYQVRKKINILDLPLVQNILSLMDYIGKEAHRPNSGQHMLFEILHYRFLGIDPSDIVSITTNTGFKTNTNSWRQILSDTQFLSTIKLRNVQAITRFSSKLTGWISDAANLTLQILFEKILNESGLLQHILKSNDRFWLMQVITTLFDFIKAECSKHPRIRIDEFLAVLEQMDVHRISLPLSHTVQKGEGVNLTTCHSAKGLEFSHVFLIGCTSDKWESGTGGIYNFSLPDTLTFTYDENRLESSRRLFYVAMTRAKKSLTISYAAKANDDRDLEASRFIAESGIPVVQEIVSKEWMAELQVVAMKHVIKPKIELFDRDYINSVLERFALSPSSLNSYLKCPIGFYFENIIRVPTAKSDSMAFGSAVHFTLKRLFERMRIAGSVFPSAEEMFKDFEFEMNRNKDCFTEKQFENRMLFGRQVLPEFHAQYVKSWNKITVTEYMIRNVEVDGVPMKGMIDKIEFIGNDVNVVDYKTGSVQFGLKKLRPPVADTPPVQVITPELAMPKNGFGQKQAVIPFDEEIDDHIAHNYGISNGKTIPDPVELYGGDYWRQIVFYKILLDNHKWKNWNMVSGEIDFIEKNEKTNEFLKAKIHVNSDDVRFVKKLIISSYKKIMNHEFTEGCGREECTWCNFVKEYINQN